MHAVYPPTVNLHSLRVTWNTTSHKCYKLNSLEILYMIGHSDLVIYVCLALGSVHICVQYECSIISHIGKRGRFYENRKWLLCQIDLIFQVHKHIEAAYKDCPQMMPMTATMTTLSRYKLIRCLCVACCRFSLYSLCCVRYMYAWGMYKSWGLYWGSMDTLVASVDTRVSKVGCGLAVARP